ncbi:hypothetical protein FPS98_16725 [Brevibacillus brevis]|uniref:Recombinase zinc beta ribbon domain-containing protein n=1 Tax=Brevibacillus brevis TaxID=1393 RepID=A0A517IGZ1_BREBE|nr:hypothetical protein FPS98_16725 [Brevibacillus brevis]
MNPTKSPLLLTGVTRCGHCDSAITATYNYKSWTLADGTKQKKPLAKYCCSGKALRATDCEGQTILAKKRLRRMYLNKCTSI